MKQAQIERLSIRTVLAIGFCVTLGLWLYTGWAFTQRIDALQTEASTVASRYTRAQELLSTVRAQVLLSSVRVRDALLDPQPAALRQYREQVEASYRIITMAIADYQPVVSEATQRDQLRRLSSEIDQFHSTSMDMLVDAAEQAPPQIRDVLNRHIIPRREAALAISEEIQSLNRQAFIAQQADIASIHRTAESTSRRQLGLALVVGLGTVLLTSLYAGRLESRLRHQLQRDAQMSAELQQVASKVIGAQEEERRTIARELHDEVGQVLGAIHMELEAAQRAIETGHATSATLGEAHSITLNAMQTVRNLSQLLHPAALDDLGLPAAIAAALRGMERRHHIRAHLHHTALPARLPREVELAAYRIVQEGISNIAKHAKATQCNVRLTQLDDRLLIEVEDDGIGFIEETERPIVARGLGLISIRERANRLGGTFNILSAPGNGTRLIVSLPEGGAVA
jgi:signal transduction histidine kinase